MIASGVPLQIAVLVVTYNRKELLRQCLAALLQQTAKIEHLVIVDNASTDGTTEWLREWMPANYPGAQLVAMNENMGGAGGFSAGLKHAIDGGAEWVWMMDDDASPHVTALEELLKVAGNPQNIYGSLAVAGPHTAWATTLVDELRVVNTSDQIPTQARVEYIPFLGFSIHRDLVKKIGLPDAGFFIAADDVEYCVRARRAGAEMIIAGKSRIEHPRAQVSQLNVCGKKMAYLSLPPWKRYYDTRNRILIARQYYGIRLFTQTMPGTLVRLFAALVSDPCKSMQLRAFAAGMVDGLLGIKGRRHTKWGIGQ
jgi:GT2 family glycosyltransferase